MFTILFVCVTVLLLTLLYKSATSSFNFWKEKGVPYPKPLPIVGNFLEVFTFRSTIGHHLLKLCNEFNAAFFGIYVINRPYLVVKSPELIKSILVTDFNHFQDRNVLADEECDPVMAHAVAFVKNPEWKGLRAKLTPMFSIAKIKRMLGLITEVTEEMINYIEKNIDKSYIEAKDVASKLTIDVIATCAFGIKAHCFDSEDSEFLNIGKMMFEPNWKGALIQFCYFIAPNLIKHLKLPLFQPAVNDFGRRVFMEAIEERKRSKVKRNDLIDLINEIDDEKIADGGIRFEGDRLVAQPLLFIATGYETSSSAIAFTLYELCLAKDVQNKLRSEIKTVLTKSGELTYEALQEMKYMDMVIYETLRKYPTLTFLDRNCVKDYKIPNTDIVINEGTPIFVPLFAIHYNPEFYPDPERFDPERFANKSHESSCYLPFGSGPRGCLGRKFGMTEIKVALSRILTEFEVERCAETPVPLEFSTTSLLLASKVGLPMKFKKHI